MRFIGITSLMERSTGYFNSFMLLVCWDLGGWSIGSGLRWVMVSPLLSGAYLQWLMRWRAIPSSLRLPGRDLDRGRRGISRLPSRGWVGGFPKRGGPRLLGSLIPGPKKERGGVRMGVPCSLSVLAGAVPV